MVKVTKGAGTVIAIEGNVLMIRNDATGPFKVGGRSLSRVELFNLAESYGIDYENISTTEIASQLQKRIGTGPASERRMAAVFGENNFNRVGRSDAGPSIGNGTLTGAEREAYIKKMNERYAREARKVGPASASAAGRSDAAGNKAFRITFLDNKKQERSSVIYGVDADAAETEFRRNHGVMWGDIVSVKSA